MLAGITFRRSLFSIEDLRAWAIRAAYLSKPIVTSTLRVFSVVMIVVANIGLLNTTTNGYTIFFDCAFALIVIGVAMGGYIREWLARRIYHDLNNQLEKRLVDIYGSKYKLSQSEARSTALEVISGYTLDSIFDFIEQQEQK